MPKKVSIDEVLNKRQQHIKSSERSDVLTKGVLKAPASWNDSDRSARFVMSTEAVDRYGDIVVTEGIDLSLFQKNPVGLLFHANRNWPIGTWDDLQKNLNSRPPRLEGTLKFVDEGTLDEADTAATLVKQSVIRAVSIGFMSLDIEILSDKEGHWTGYKFMETELVECSVVSVPAHPDALVKGAGGDNALALDMIEHVLETYVRGENGLIVPRSKYVEMWKSLSEDVGEKSHHEVVLPVEDTSQKDTEEQQEKTTVPVVDDAEDPPVTQNFFKKWAKEFTAKFGTPEPVYVEHGLDEAKQLQSEISELLEGTTS